MSIRKLVQLDDDGWCMDLDMVKLRRVATEFRAWVVTVDPNNDPFGFLRWDLPLVDAVLKGTIALPYKGGSPHNWEIREGFLDWYLEIAAPFYNTIRGAHRTPPQIIEKDGKRYAGAEFDDSLDATDGRGTGTTVTGNESGN